MLLGLCCSLYNLSVAEWYKSALPFLIKSIYQRQAAAIPSHLFVVYYSPGVPKGLDGSKVTFPLYYWKTATKLSLGLGDLGKKLKEKKCIRELARNKSLQGNSKIAKVKNNHWECLCKTTIFFLPTRISTIHFERERIKKARNISPSCPTLQSPTALLHPKQQVEMQNHAICDLQRQSSVFAWVGERDSQAYHQLEKMANKNALVAL